MYIGICDDESSSLEILSKYVTEYSSQHELPCTIFCFESGENLVSAIQKGQEFDLLFLDIYIGPANGISVAKTIREMGKTCSIVFATSSPYHAIDSYGLQAIHYLLKPLTIEGVSVAMDRAIQRLPERIEKYIQIQNRQGFYKVSLDDIVYAESDVRIVIIHTRAQGCVEYYDRLDNFESQCGDSRFLRCHKSFLVNLDFVQAIEDNSFVLKSGPIIRISMRISQAKSLFAAYKASCI